ncbi:MAG: ThuA domain-containing protein [Pirellulales bacterium]|nr:ThuA domain-containing protein [Pirellulales bacterium]
MIRQVLRFSVFCAAAGSLVCAISSAVAADTTSKASAAAKKKVLFIAGKPSHGYGEHEHHAGCQLLAAALNESGLPIEVVVHQNGWPNDPRIFDGVAAVVMYCDGGTGHMVMDHLSQLDELANKGVGIGAIHYAVEVPTGRSGSYFLDWMGGYFEADWSVNPHWTAKFQALPKHPVTRGVKPFTINDEWYFHMRFRENMDRVTPILTAIPPASTMARGDGPHEGNPTVRQEVAAGVPQHMMWVVERPDGGRGFGCTGAHYHWNWGNDRFRMLMLNAICWIAKVDVPASGVASKSLTVDDLLENLDDKPPGNFSREKIEAMLKDWQP